MSAPLVVSIPHRLGREEASRRLKAGLTRAASSIPVLKVDEERWEENRMIFRVRALGQAASGHLDVADDHVRLEVTLPWLLQRFAQAAFVSVLVTNSTEDQTLRGRREPTSHGSRHDIRQAVRPSIPGGLLFFNTLDFRAGFKAPSNLAFNTTAGRCRNRAERRTSVAPAS